LRPRTGVSIAQNLKMVEQPTEKRRGYIGSFSKLRQSLDGQKPRTPNLSRGTVHGYSDVAEEDEDSDLSDRVSGSRHQRPRELLFVPVTETEISEHCRNVPFGLRISHLILNDALQEIEHVLSKKISLENTVSEQELRENCAFFRHGESTARNILSLLCSLKRLKQVPGQNKEIITYLWL